jgi:asparaginyl-tRNA synthetase
MLKRTVIKKLLADGVAGSKVLAKGWVRTKRGSKSVNFIALNDGSTINNIQVVADVELIGEDLLKKISTGAALSVEGELVASQGSGQSLELIAETIVVLGEANPDEYPIQPKKHSMEFLRENAHLRMRTSTFSAVMRIRHAMTYAIHTFFTKEGLYNLHTPIITSSDAEGAGEMFQVTALDLNNPPKDEEGKVDFSQDFFARPTNLTVSGQLEGELGAMALGGIYTFGPTFRAENSNTTRHLAEFWMVEPEVAFNDLHDNMALAEKFMKFLLSYAIDNCADDLKFLEERQLNEEKALPKDKRHDSPLIERLQSVIDEEFVRIDYTEAIRLLERSKPFKKGKFQHPVSWGVDLASEHERYLVEKEFKKPVIIYDYPKDIKSFYMKQNDDGKTVGAMDVLFPGIGEIIGGSEREVDYDKLTTRMDEMGVPTKELYWYLDTRKFGTAPHSGFGLGFERLILFVTGMSNIRDVIPFPRTPQSANF